jgi:hypothetical protein
LGSVLEKGIESLYMVRHIEDMAKMKIVRRRRSRKLVKVSIRLPSDLVDDLDDVADQLETTRTDVIEKIVDAFFEDSELINEVFGVDEESLSDED